jgi:hypothetical protein
MNRKEAARLAAQENTLCKLGFTASEAESLRRISMTLRRWYEMECGTGEGQVSISVERDENGKPFRRYRYPTKGGYVDKRCPIADRESGALRRLSGILAARNGREADRLSHYVQTDPRGPSLYILRPGDVPADEDVSCYYSRGICVY